MGSVEKLMAAHQLTVTVTDPTGTPIADEPVTIAPVVSDRPLPVGDDIVLPETLTATTNAMGAATFSLLPTSETGVKYAVEFTGGVRALFNMPASDTTLAAAIGYPDADVVTLPFQGWQLSGTAPQNPAPGDGWVDSDNHTLEVWSGTRWINVAAAAQAATHPLTGGLFHIGATAPSNPDVGDLWLDRPNEELKLWTGSEFETIASTGGGGVDIAALETRVTTAEATLITQGNLITGAENAVAALTTRLGTDEQALVTETAARAAADTALGTRIDDLDIPDTSGLATQTALAAETSARQAADTALGTRIDNLPTGGGGTSVNVSVTQTNTPPSNPNEGDLWLFQLSTAADSPTLILRIWDGSAWRIPTAFIGNRGTANASSHELTFGRVQVGGTTYDNVLAYRGSSGTSLVFPATEPTSAVRSALTALTGRVAQAETDITALEAGGGGGGGGGTPLNVTYGIGATPPADPNEGDMWLRQVTTGTRPVVVLNVWDGTAWRIPTAIVGNRGTSNVPPGQELTYGDITSGGQTHQDVLGYQGAHGTHLVFPATEPTSAVRTDVDAQGTRLTTAEATLVTQGNLITGAEAAVTALNTRTNLAASQRTRQTLTTTDPLVTIYEVVGLGIDDDIYLPPAKVADDGTSPVFDFVDHATQGVRLRNPSEDFVAGQSYFGGDLETGGEAMFLAKVNLTGSANGKLHTLWANQFISCQLVTQATSTQIRLIPAGASGRQLTLNIDLGMNGVGDAIVGVQLTQSETAVRATAAINGTSAGAPQTIPNASAPLSLATRTNFGCAWRSPLSGTTAGHLQGDIWDVVVASRAVARTHTAFAATTSLASGAITDRTNLYDLFSVASQSYFTDNIHWSDRNLLPISSAGTPFVWRLRDFLPLPGIQVLHLGAAANEEINHRSEAFLTIDDQRWLRRCLVDLDEDTIGNSGAGTDVVVSTAVVNGWQAQGKTMSLVKSWNAPIWSAFTGYPEAPWYDPLTFGAWSIVLIRSNATSLDVPEGYASHIVARPEAGRRLFARDERWVRLGVEV